MRRSLNEYHRVHVGTCTCLHGEVPLWYLCELRLYSTHVACLHDIRGTFPLALFSRDTRFQRLCRASRERHQVHVVASKSFKPCRASFAAGDMILWLKHQLYFHLHIRAVYRPQIRRLTSHRRPALGKDALSRLLRTWSDVLAVGANCPCCMLATIQTTLAQ